MEGSPQDGMGERIGLSALEERLGPQVERVRDTLVTLNQRALRLLREHPGASLAVAVGVGFLLGRLASRR